VFVDVDENQVELKEKASKKKKMKRDKYAGCLILLSFICKTNELQFS